MKGNSHIRKIPWFLALLGLCLPLVYQVSEFHWVRGLKGFQASPDTVAWSWENFHRGSYQNYREGQLKHDLRFKAFYIRLNNELKFDLFNKFTLPDIIQGKDGWLYNPYSIEAYYGGEEIDTTQIENLGRKLAESIDSLKKRGTEFLFVIEPSKVAIYPEHLPPNDHDPSDSLPSYRLWQEVLGKNDVPLFNAYELFQQWKDTASFGLFTKGGYHWSQEAVYKVWDSLYSQIEFMTGLDLPDYSYKAPQLTLKPNKIDRDLADAANLFWSSLVKEPYIYPQIQVNQGPASQKPSVLLLGDSFYWNFHVDYLDNLFFEEDFIFWYYYDQPYVGGASRYTKRKIPLELKEAIEGRDIIIYMIFLNNIRYCCWDFIEDLHNLLVENPQ